MLLQRSFPRLKFPASLGAPLLDAPLKVGSYKAAPPREVRRGWVRSLPQEPGFFWLGAASILPTRPSKGVQGVSYLAGVIAIAFVVFGWPFLPIGLPLIGGLIAADFFLE